MVQKEKRSKNVSIGLLLGILSVFSLAQSTQVIAPALQSLSEYYQDIPYSRVLMLSSIVSLAVIPCSTIAGSLAGRKVKYKTLALTAMVLVLVGGLLPLLVMESFSAVFVCRILVGMGVGIATPLSSALIMKLLPASKQALWQGVGTAVMNVCGVFYQSVSGFICTVNLRMTWAVYGFLLIPLLLAVFFLKEPAQTEEEAAVSAKRERLPVGTIMTCIGFGLLYLFLSPVLLGISSILVREEIGTAASAGVILSAYSIGGMAAGFCYGAVDRLLKKWTIPVSLLLQVAGLAACAFGKNVLLLGAGTVLFGISIHWIWPACVVEFGKLKSGGAAASGLFISCMHLGTFSAAPLIGFIGRISGNDSPRLPVIAGCIGTVIVAAIWIGCKLKQDKQN